MTVLIGRRGGKYPHGNSLLVQGTRESILIDPLLSVVPRAAGLPPIDRVLDSPCHEDHIAGNHLFSDLPWFLHQLDAPVLRSLDDKMAIYGCPAHIDAAFQIAVVNEFRFTPRPHVTLFGDRDVFDLGSAPVRAIHLPGHTRDHCVFHVSPDDVLDLGDIDLSSFGPYYGDAWWRTLNARWRRCAAWRPAGTRPSITSASSMGARLSSSGSIASRP